MTDENPDRYPDRYPGPNWRTVDQLEQENIAQRHRHGKAWRLIEPDSSELERRDWLWIGGIVIALAAVIGLIVVAACA